MSDMTDRSDEDPRHLPPSADDLAAADLAAAPAVPRGREGVSLWVGFVVLAVVAVVLFLWLSAGRRRAQEGGVEDAASQPPAVSAPPTTLALPPQPAAGPITNVPAPQFTTDNAVRTPPAPSAMAMTPTPMVSAATPPGVGPAPPTLDQRRRAPALVVDLGGEAPATPALPRRGAQPARPEASPGVAQDAAAAASGVSAEERFAARVGAQDNERAVADRLRNPGLVVPEGATIPATLETALDSDLPGYARAVVSRDVRSFDGRNVLVPRGSRVIGQYKAATSLGAARVFVIWTRLIRPDGGSIQLASPAADDLGRAGLGGRVDSHFFARFGGAILLTVLNAGTAALASSQTGAQVYIGNSSDATSAAAAAVTRDGARPPTIRTPQGAAVNIFVARDLDFSPVGPAR